MFLIWIEGVLDSEHLLETAFPIEMLEQGFFCWITAYAMLSERVVALSRVRDWTCIHEWALSRVMYWESNVNCYFLSKIEKFTK